MKIGKGHFISGGFLGAEVTAILFNTSNSRVHYDLIAFDEGRKAFDMSDIHVLEPRQTAILSKDNCEALAEQGAYPRRLFVLRCRDESPANGYLSLDFQITYRRAGIFTTLLDTTLPLATDRSVRQPQVLLDQKVWVGRDANSVVVMLNALNLDDLSLPLFPVHFQVIDQSGKVVIEQDLNPRANSPVFFDTHEAYKSAGRPLADLEYVTVAAKGGGCPVPIHTFTTNKAIGFALEHSLAPHYYFTGDRDKVRREALSFDRQAS